MPEPQVIFSHSAHPDAAHDLAQPTSVAIPCQNLSGEQVFLLKSVGGLTKLEQVAAMVMAANSGTEIMNDQQQMNWAIESVERAEKLLAICAKRQAPKEVEERSTPSIIEVAG